MANLPETPQWEDGIYQIEVSDPVLGGPDGISNRQGKQLASRTLYLKQQVEKGGSDLAKHIAAADPHTQYAPKASPTFTGTPTAPTPAANDNSKKLVTTEFVARAIAALAGTAPETLDTLKELADALGNDPNFATTVLNKLAEKLAKDQNGADIPDPALFVKNLGLKGGVNTDAIGRLVGCKVFTSSEAYTPSPGTKFIVAELQGAGGGGGGVGTRSASGSMSIAASGGGGGYGKFLITNLASSYVITIGSGGSSGAASTSNNTATLGSNGGNTTLGTIATATGGAGAAPGASNIPGLSVIAGRMPGGYASGTGLINVIPGGNSKFGLALTAIAGASGCGGGSYFGNGGQEALSQYDNTAQAGTQGAAVGSGGSGAISTGTGPGAAGGKGADGIAIIWEYA